MKAGDVVVVRFPFAGVESTKKRPAIVLARTSRSPRNRIATVAMITSQIEASHLRGDVELSQWREAGLLHPSLARMAKVATIDEDLIDKVLGELSPGDRKSTRLAFHDVFAEWLR